MAHIMAAEALGIATGEAGPVQRPAAPEGSRDAGVSRDETRDGPVQPQWAGPEDLRTWITFYHRADSGAAVRLGLRRAGIEVHWPRMILRLPRRDDVIRPLFPGYCFGAVDPARQPYMHLRDVDKVLGIVGLRERGVPTALRRGEVEALIAMAGGAIDGVIDTTPDSRPVFAKGQTLRVVAGPFQGLLATFKGDRPNDRVRVLMHVLGAAEADVPASHVEAADKGQE